MPKTFLVRQRSCQRTSWLESESSEMVPGADPALDDGVDTVGDTAGVSPAACTIGSSEVKSPRRGDCADQGTTAREPAPHHVIQKLHSAFNYWNAVMSSNMDRYLHVPPNERAMVPEIYSRHGVFGSFPPLSSATRFGTDIVDRQVMTDRQMTLHSLSLPVLNQAPISYGSAVDDHASPIHHGSPPNRDPLHPSTRRVPCTTYATRAVHGTDADLVPQLQGSDGHTETRSVTEVFTGGPFIETKATCPANIEMINGGFGIKNPLLSPDIQASTGQDPLPSGQFPCKVCGRRFEFHRLLQRHLKSHCDVKRYLCTFCGKGFNDTFDLKRHTRTHTGVRPYKCDLCDKAFTQRCSLESHCRKIHGLHFRYGYKERRGKVYVCEDCGHVTEDPEAHFVHIKDTHPFNPAILKCYDKRQFKFEGAGKGKIVPDGAGRIFVE